MSFEELAKSRFTCRSFSSKPIEDEKLGKILEIGNAAPTAKNYQPQRIYVLKSKEALKKLDQLTPCRYHAPVVLLFVYDVAEEFHNPLDTSSHSGVEDCSIVATHMMLEAKELGLDSAWINYFSNEELEKAFSLPENYQSVLLLDLGYRAEDALPSENHSKKKDLDDIVSYL